jgi:competence protein ComEC
MAYGAGLATGLLHFGAPASVGLLALGAAATRRPLALLAGTAVLVGRLNGEIAWIAESSRCTSRLPERAVRLTVRLLEPVDAAGGRIAVRPVSRCAGSVIARWPRHHAAAAGVEVPVEARWLPRRGVGGRRAGTLVVSRVGEPVLHGRAGDGLRTYLFDTSHRLYGTRAGMVDALILGRRGGIDPALQDQFAWSGLVHLLSISGFHVGLITAWVVLLGRAAGLARPRALLLAAATSVAYVAFLGWPAPAARAATLSALIARCRIRQRHVQATPLLSATCLLVLLVDPWAIVDLGGWLSAAALWGASTFSRWSDRALRPHFVWRTLSSSVGATLATAPITAAALGTVAPVGIVLNFAAIPLAAVAVPGVIASLLLPPVSDGVAGALAAGAGLTLHLLELTAALGAAVPGGHVVFESGSVAAAVPWALILVAGLWTIGTGNTAAEAGRRIAWLATAGLWIGPLGQLARGSADSGRDLALHFLDVGQGDAAAIRTPGGHWAVIDAGPAGGGSDAGRRVVAPFLMRHGVRQLAVAFVSHAHADHLGGLPAVLRTVRAGVVIEPATFYTDPLYLGFLRDLTEERIAWHPGRAGECFQLDGVTFTILHPGGAWTRWGEDINEDSLVLLVEYGDFQVLFAGDAGFAAEHMLAGSVRPVDLLKVGHHGSRGSTGADFLARVRPKVAVISVGRNEYGHPAPATLARLDSAGAIVRRTDRDGTVSVTTDGRTMSVRAGSTVETYEVHGSLQTQPGAACRHP